MNHLLRTTAIVAVMGCFSIAAQAQQSDGEAAGADTGTMNETSYCDKPWEKVDGNADGFVSKAEASASVENQFGQIDLDGNGELTKTEWVDCLSKMRDQTVAAQEPATSIREILADLEENNLSAEEILGISSPPVKVNFVDLDGFAGADRERLEETLDNTEDGAAEVQTAIARNEVLEVSVRERDLSISQLVAATRSEDGEVTIYTDKPFR